MDEDKYYARGTLHVHILKMIDLGSPHKSKWNDTTFSMLSLKESKHKR